MEVSPFFLSFLCSGVFNVSICNCEGCFVLRRMRMRIIGMSAHFIAFT